MLIISNCFESRYRWWFDWTFYRIIQEKKTIHSGDEKKKILFLSIDQPTKKIFFFFQQKYIITSSLHIIVCCCTFDRILSSMMCTPYSVGVWSTSSFNNNNNTCWRNRSKKKKIFLISGSLYSNSINRLISQSVNGCSLFACIHFNFINLNQIKNVHLKWI